MTLCETIKQISNYLIGGDILEYYSIKKNHSISEHTSSFRQKYATFSQYTSKSVHLLARYIPLSIEGLFIYEYMINDLPLFELLILSAGIRLVESSYTNSKRNSQDISLIFDRIESTIDKFEEELEKFKEVYEQVRDSIKDNPNFFNLFEHSVNKPYELLGIEKEASQDDIKKAYRILALELHPDRNLTENESKTKKFIEVTKAYYQMTGQCDKL